MESSTYFRMPTNTTKMKKLLLAYTTQLPFIFFLRQTPELIK